MKRSLITTAWLAAMAFGCSSGGNGDPPPSGAAERRQLLASVVERVILPGHRAFAESADALVLAADAYSTAVQSGAADVAERQTAARDAWRAAMSAWQACELFQLGPTGATGVVMAGRGLRDEVYSWPSTNTCRIDQEIVDAQYGQPGFFEAKLVNVYGLDALEYLFFYESPDNTCAPQVRINSDGSWAALSAEEKAQRRADYGRAVAGNVAEMARTLVNVWAPEGEGFGQLLANPGEGASPFRSAQGAMDDLFAAMFYLDLKVKDAKIAEPAGISGRCSASVCPELLESRRSGHSKENLIANMRSFRRLFHGGEPGAEGAYGFDDLLTALGAKDVGDEVAIDTANAVAALEAIPGTLEAALASDLESVRAAHAATKLVTDHLKTRFVTVLGLRVPQEGAADND